MDPSFPALQLENSNLERAARWYLGCPEGLAGEEETHGHVRGRERFSPQTIADKISVRWLSLVMASVLAFATLYSAPQQSRADQINPSLTTQTEVANLTTSASSTSMHSPSLHETRNNPSAGDPLFRNLSPEDQKIAREKVEGLMKGRRADTGKINTSKLWRSMIRQEVANPIHQIPPEEQTHFTDLMVGMITQESGGIPWAVAGKNKADLTSLIANEEGDVAVGLFQMKKSTGEQVAKWLNMPSFNLKNPIDSVKMGVEYQARLSRVYPNDLNIWAHHLGMGNMDYAIKTYLLEVAGLDTKEVMKAFSDNNKTATAEFIKKYQLNPVKLLTNPKVVEALKTKGAFEDQTDEYPFLVYGWSEVISKG